MGLGNEAHLSACVQHQQLHHATSQFISPRGMRMPQPHVHAAAHACVHGVWQAPRCAAAGAPRPPPSSWQQQCQQRVLVAKQGASRGKRGRGSTTASSPPTWVLLWGMGSEQQQPRPLRASQPLYTYTD